VCDSFECEAAGFGSIHRRLRASSNTLPTLRRRITGTYGTLAPSPDFSRQCAAAARGGDWYHLRLRQPDRLQCDPCLL